MQHYSSAPAPSDVCSVCSKQFSKYRCPRCFVAYCGVACYKSHNSSGCAEAFYRECAVDHLKGTRADVVEGHAASAAEEMTEILRRVQMQVGREQECFEDEIMVNLGGFDVNVDSSAGLVTISSYLGRGGKYDCDLSSILRKGTLPLFSDTGSMFWGRMLWKAP